LIPCGIISACASRRKRQYRLLRSHACALRARCSLHPAPELPDLPYVCLRLPTGGGKTFVAAHSISVAAKELLHTDEPLVLWLVPSNAILQQTLKALRDRKHPYRQALETAGGNVSVMDTSEALAVQPSQLQGLP